ncbi:MAG: hypothetical protein PHT16_01395 [Candidatus Pacebacteria bacterium]|nr:hypothetical protein [Candidatus Paceibacterota bacterium]
MSVVKENYSKFSPKFFFALLLCLVVRLIPFRAPNVEPILATMMPFSKAYGAFIGFSFAVLSIFIYDLLTGTMGIQTLFTVGAYGVLGLWSASYFKKYQGSRWDYVRFAIFGTLFFDAFTGFTVGPIFFHQSFTQSFFGQIPFTALHLTGNVIFALILSPAIYKNLIKKKEKNLLSPSNIFNPKII